VNTIVSTTKQHIGKYTYLYESTSYRDQQGRPRNKKTKIATINPNTNQTTYTPQYLKTHPELTTTQQPTTNPPPTTANIKEILDKTKTYGTTYFLTQLAQKIGLTKTLQTTLPNNHNQILTLATYLITQNKPINHCQDWQTQNHNPNQTATTLSSQRISELLDNINENQKNNFYKQWHNHIKEQENIA